MRNQRVVVTSDTFRSLLKRNHLALPLALVLAAGLSCDKLTAPPTTGSIDVVLQSASGANLALAPRHDDEPNVDLSVVASSTLTNVFLDGARVTVTGPMTKTVTLATATGGLSIDGLAPGAYTVVVEGLVGGRVGHYGEKTNVNVTAGISTTAPVLFNVFQPVVLHTASTDTARVLRFPVSFSAVPNATSYIVEWSTSPTMAGAQSISVASTSTEVSVPGDGTYYFTVRGANPVVATAGLPSPVGTVHVFQVVATVTVSPASPSVTAGATQQFTFDARDSDNVVVTNPPVFWVSNNTAVATISSTGLATTITSGTAVISAVAKGTPGATTLTANPMAPTKLVFSTQPANTTAGQSMASIQVSVQNPQNQVATSDNTTQITVAFGNNAGGGTLGGTKTLTVTNGVASFTTLSVNATGAGYTLTATAPATAFAAATSSGFNITPAGASQLAFIAQPTTVSAGATMPTAVQVEIRDVLGNRAIAATDAIAIAIGTNPSAGTLSGTKIVNAVNGIASFSGLSIDKNGTDYTLTATAGSLLAANSAAFNVSAATNLAFLAGGSNAVAGSALPAIQVEVRDGFGNRLTSMPTTVTLSFGANPGGGTLAGTTAITSVNGVATFSGISIAKAAAGYTLVASAPGPITAPPTAAFTISPAAATRLAFFAQPSSVTTDDFVSVSLNAQDAFGNLVSTPMVVDVALGANPGGATLSGTTTVAVGGGVAAFGDLQVDKVGTGYTLVARTAAGTLAPVTSTPFNMGVGAPAKLAFKTPPTDGEPTGTLNTIDVALTDAAGNQTSVDGVNVSLGLAANPGASSLSGGNPVATVGGVATFTNVSIDNAANGYTLVTSNVDGFSDETSLPFDVFLHFVHVSAGYQHACGLTNRGNAYCWGEGFVGQLGDGLQAQSLTPSKVSGGHQFSQVVAGYQHSCGLRTDGAAYCWGLNNWGEVGDGTAGTPRIVPVLVLGGHQWASLMIGLIHTCGVDVNGAAFCWGNNQAGNLGDGGPSTDKNVPTAVTGGHVFTQLTGGHTHTCGIRTDGAAYCWGRQSNGRLGNGLVVPADLSTPQAVVGGHTFLSISGGREHTCAVRAPATDRRAMCWGLNSEGRLGVGDQLEKGSPTFVVAGHRYSGLASAGENTCGVAVGGDAFCWGTAANGRLGNADILDDASGGPYLSPVAILGGHKFVSISGHRWVDGFSCGVTQSGAYCWGFNGAGELGDGSALQSSTPQLIKGSR